MIKQSLRESLLNIRKSLTEETILKARLQVLSSIKKDTNYQKSKVIGLYSAIANEINIDDLKQDTDKRFALPVVVLGEIRYYEVTKDSVMVANAMGILEPKERMDITDLLEYVLVPAIGLSDDYFRIGYGKGHFDKFFQKYPQIIKVGICHYFARINFEPSSYDIPMDYGFSG